MFNISGYRASYRVFNVAYLVLEIYRGVEVGDFGID
jgi:hypothetical protein